MSYKAGSLEIELLGIDTNAVKSIQDTAKALNILSNAFRRIEQTQIVLVGQKLEHIFTKIASATKSIDTTNLTALASAGKSLSAISRIGNLEKVDFAKVGKGFENLSVAITPFLEKVKSAEASLTALYGTLSKASGKKIQGLLGGNTATPKGKNGGAFSFLNVAKWGSILYLGRRFGRVLGDIVQAGADYTETLNLWETAMGDNLNVATEFVNKMNEAYGISEKTLMNAQAIFKNMLGSLGEISDTMAYSLSEGITQMALDYASLYNVTFDSAFKKFQSALAGQVRPIRSVSGYDITENTLFQLYQTLGGTKTMRQLTRTEKQLLAIYAVFQQMERSGAVGDLDKTMSSFANQSRVMAEAWQQVKTYAGLTLTKMIEDSGLMVNLNAILLFLGDTLKAVAESMGAIRSFGGDIFENTTDSALDASDALDEVKGKLLDFDKFRSLSGSEENVLGLDEKLLQALSGYDTILGNASMEARNLANNLKTISGLFDENGVFDEEKWKRTINYIKAIGIALGSLFGGWLLISIIKFFVSPLGMATMALSALVFGIVSFINAWKDMSVLTRAIGIIFALTGALAGLLIGIYAFQSLPIALGLASILGGAILGVYSMLKPDLYANGGLPDKGTMFIAGEAGAEIVYNTPSGQSGVANVQQIAQATRAGTLQAVKEWWSQARNDIPQFREVSKTGIYEVAKSEMRRRGEW